MTTHDAVTSALGQGFSLATIAGAFTHILPAVATILAILWYGTQLIEWVEEHTQKSCYVKNKTEDHNDGYTD